MGSLLQIPLFLLCILGPVEVFSQVPGFGQCPNHPVMEKFNYRKFLGEWYEVARQFTWFELGWRCVYSNVTDLGGKVLGFMDKAVTIFSTKLFFFERTNPLDPKDPAKLVFQPFDVVPFRLKLWILDTDYKEYCILWTCVDFLKVAHAENLWIYSRNKTVSRTTKKKIIKFLDKNKINRHGLKHTDQTNCPW
ncbi:apolipoprotein D-like [Tachypleus tridentatus]|uniref:apolipoprotein D-like n=1 Tax=Tachypleus tridentatus TaxID=6853 RepID=UPI003FD021F0